MIQLRDPNSETQTIEARERVVVTPQNLPNWLLIRFLIQ
jgi:hypothetical protein